MSGQYIERENPRISLRIAGVREIWNVSRGKVLNYLISAHLKQAAGCAFGCLPAHLTRNGSGPYIAVEAPQVRSLDFALILMAQDNFCGTGSIQVCSWHGLFHGIVSGCRVSLVTPRRSESSFCRPRLQELLPAVDLSDGAPVTTSRGGYPGADAKVFDACS